MGYAIVLLLMAVTACCVVAILGFKLYLQLSWDKRTASALGGGMNGMFIGVMNVVWLKVGVALTDFENHRYATPGHVAS